MTELIDPVLFSEGIKDTKNNTTIEKLKKKYSYLDPAYVVASCVKERRDFLLKMWNFYKNICPETEKNFIKDLKTKGKFLERGWEMYLAYILDQNNFVLLKHKSNEPDIKIKYGAKNIWIEAIAVDEGEVDKVEPMPELEPGKIYSWTHGVAEIDRPRLIRLSSVFVKKYEKIQKYIENGVIQKNDLVFIAINNQRIEHFSSVSRIIKGLVFGVGLDTYTRGNDLIMKKSFQIRDTVLKKNGKGEEVKIELGYFLKKEFSEINGLIMCDDHIFNTPIDWENGVGSNLHVAYNLLSERKLRKQLFKFSDIYLGYENSGKRFIFDLDKNQIKLPSRKAIKSFMKKTKI